MKHLLLIFTILPALASPAQVSDLSVAEFTNSLEKYVSDLSAENTHYSFVSRTYIDDSGSVFEEERGDYYRGSNLDYAVYTNKTVTIQSATLKVVVVELNQTIYLMNPDSLLTQFALPDGSEERWKCSLQKIGAVLTLRATNVDQSKSLYTEYYITDNHLDSLRLQYAPGNYVQTTADDETVEEPHVLLIYGEATALTKEEMLRLQIRNYIREDAGKFVVNERLRPKYQLVDLRIPTN